MRVAISFSKLRADTTGIYYERAFRKLGHAVKHFTPREFDALEGDPGFDLYVVVDDGMEIDVETRQVRKFPDVHPLAYVVIDTHVRDAWYTWRLNLAKRADVIACAQKNGAARMNQDTGKAFWLPLGCDPEIHRGGEDDKDLTIAFIGHLDAEFHMRRLAVLDQVMRPEFEPWYFGNKYLRDATDTYSRSHVVLNVAVDNDINMRFFEAMASGALLLTDRIKGNGVEELPMREGLHFMGYDGPEDVAASLRTILGQPARMKEVAVRGQAEVLNFHTYENRVKRLLNEVDQRCLSVHVQPGLEVGGR